MKSWSINGRFLTQPQSGVQRYAREVVTALDRELQSNIADATPTQDPIRVELLIPANASVDISLTTILPRRVGRLSGHAWEQLELPFHANGPLLSLCNTGPVLHPNQIVAIHDVNTREFPQSYTRTFRLAYRVLQPILGKTAQSITTVSNFSANQIAVYKIAAPSKITQAPNGCDHTKRWHQQTPAIRNIRIDHDTILVLGTNAPHKNLRLLTGLADRFANHGLRLAVIGMTSDRVFNADARNSDHPAIQWCGRVPDNELAYHFANALCLAFPSWTEGFGLPPLEAMSLGCPVVASDRTSIPEVCGQAAIYAAPHDPDAWLAAFLALRNDTDMRQKLIAAGHIQASRYTWQATARAYLSLISATQTGHEKLTSIHAAKRLPVA
jgi:glycosyltransferase involved in cell wall biosynthesis